MTSMKLTEQRARKAAARLPMALARSQVADPYTMEPLYFLIDTMAADVLAHAPLRMTAGEVIAFCVIH